MRRSEKLASARPAGAPVARGGRRLKTCVSGSRATPRSRQTKPRLAGATAKLRPTGLLAGLQHLRLDAAEQAAAALGLAAVGERDDDVETLTEQAVELVLGFGKAARDEGRPLSVEGVSLALRKRVELGGAWQRSTSGNPLRPKERAPLPAARTKSGAPV